LRWWWVIALLALAGAVYAQVAPNTALPQDAMARGFRAPNYDDTTGLMTSQIFGDMARSQPNGNVEIEGLRIEFYGYTGGEREIEMTVTSPSCVYHARRGQIMSDDAIRIARDEFVVTGDGYIFNDKEQRLEILSNSKVVLQGAAKSMIMETQNE
jgi:hypothetical protein